MDIFDKRMREIKEAQETVKHLRNQAKAAEAFLNQFPSYTTLPIDIGFSVQQDGDYPDRFKTRIPVTDELRAVIMPLVRAERSRLLDEAEAIEKKFS